MIIKKQKAPMVEFGELSAGDVFIRMVCDVELIQMKISTIQEDNGTTYNSIDLLEGEACYTKPDCKVYRVVAELNIL